ncbi:MAG TPA: hypothetical protein VIT23_14510, partial [Terrimicrobiaceae bacterium]
VHEHPLALPGTLVDFAIGAPSLDFTGIDSYYEARTSDLQRVVTTFDPGRPYLLTEFGPDVYWDPELTQHDANGVVLEPLSTKKANDYVLDWNVFIEPHRGWNIGGIAYCWIDRLEATTSWFGLVDWSGREKSAFAVLKRLWTGKDPERGPVILSLQASSKALQPGETIEATAKVEIPEGLKVDYQWGLEDKDFRKITGRVTPLGDGTTARVTVPMEPGVYRLYLNANSGQTADVTNIPLTVASSVKAPKQEASLGP